MNNEINHTNLGLVLSSLGPVFSSVFFRDDLFSSSTAFSNTELVSKCVDFRRVGRLPSFEDIPA